MSLSDDKSDDKSFKFLFWVGLFLHLLAAYFSEGFYQADEHFQILEFANLKLANVKEMPWEYTAQIRSWTLPSVFYLILWPFKAIGLGNPFFLAFVARLASSLFAVFVSLKIYRYFAELFKFDALERGQFYLLNLALFFVPFFHARTSGENWAGALFFWGWILWQQRNLLWAGVLMGFAFEARFQVGFLILGAAVGRTLEIIFAQNFKLESVKAGGDARKNQLANLWREGFQVGLGFAMAFLLSRVIDFWGYGEWVLTPWKYFERNIILGEASRHGTSSAWDYLKKFLFVLPPLGAFLFYTFFKGLRRSKNLSLMFGVAFFMAAHLAVAHKEMRFLFPLLYALPALCMLGIQRNPSTIESKKKFRFLESSLFSKRFEVLSIRVLVIVNVVALLFLTLSPAKSEIELYRAVYATLKSSGAQSFTYSHVNDDPLKYAGLRPYFYVPYEVHSKRLVSLDELVDGYVIVSESNFSEPSLQGLLARKGCGVLWSDVLFKFRNIGWVERILTRTKYRHQFLIHCK